MRELALYSGTSMKVATELWKTRSKQREKRLMLSPVTAARGRISIGLLRKLVHRAAINSIEKDYSNSIFVVLHR